MVIISDWFHTSALKVKYLIRAYFIVGRLCHCIIICMIGYFSLVNKGPRDCVCVYKTFQLICIFFVFFQASFLNLPLFTGLLFTFTLKLNDQFGQDLNYKQKVRVMFFKDYDESKLSCIGKLTFHAWHAWASPLSFLGALPKNIGQNIYMFCSCLFFHNQFVEQYIEPLFITMRLNSCAQNCDNSDYSILLKNNN